MAPYNVFVEDSSPLFFYSSPGAWIDTPLALTDFPSLSYHATDIQNATVTLGFIGTGVHIFSATAPAPGSYEVFVDGQSISDWEDPNSRSDSQLLLGSITGLEMAPHTLTLVSSGVAVDVLNLARVEVESLFVGGSLSLSIATLDTADEIQWGPAWVSALGGSTFYNSTIHYTEQPDAKMSLSFEGSALAIYGTSGAEMGYYVVTLDGQSATLSGGGDGSVRIHHDLETILYLANGLGPGRHELTITANPSSLGGPQVFNLDCIRVFSGSSFSGPVPLYFGLPDTGTFLTLPPPVSTGSSYIPVISGTVFSVPSPLPTSTSPILSPSLMPSPPSTPPTLPPTANFDSFQPTHILREASNGGGFKVVTEEWVVSGAILSGIITGIGLIFFALFMWKRKILDPPSYVDLENANKPNEKWGMKEPGEKSPEFPIQPADKTGHGEEQNPFRDGAPCVQYHSRESWAERKRGHSRNGSNASSITVNETAYDSYWETPQKRAQLTTGVVSTESTCRDPSSDCYGSNDPGHIDSRDSGKYAKSVYSDVSQYSQTSERIVIDSVRMPPQFSTPMRPPSAASPPRPLKRMPPPRPPRVRESLALPF